MYILILIIFQLFLGWAAEASPVPSPSPAAVEGPSLAPVASGGGEILFFPANPERPANEQFTVQPGEKVPVCIRLVGLEFPIVDKIQKKATGFKLVLEDKQTPPNQIVFSKEEPKGLLPRSAQGCYEGTFRIPALASEGVYQVADLLFQGAGKNFYSIRELLYEFQKAEELNVKNEKSDFKGPQLEEIYSHQKPIRKISRGFQFMKIKVEQFFLFSDDRSGLDEKTLKVFYQLTTNGVREGIHEASCKRVFGEREKFKCTLLLRRPYFEWPTSHLELALESIYLRDKARNILILKDPGYFKEKAGQTPTKFEFTGVASGVPRKNIHLNERKKAIQEEPTEFIEEGGESETLPSAPTIPPNASAS